MIKIVNMYDIDTAFVYKDKALCFCETKSFDCNIFNKVTNNQMTVNFGFFV